MKVTYTSCINLKNFGPFSTFKEALKDFITRLKVQKNPSTQLLETACWIERKVECGSTLPLCFYDSRDFGFKVGLLTGESDFVENGKEPDPLLLAELYLHHIDTEEFIKRLPSLTPA